MRVSLALLAAAAASCVGADTSVAAASTVGAEPGAPTTRPVRRREAPVRGPGDGVPGHRRALAVHPGPMSWGGGPVMHGRVDVYLIFYGAWSAGRRAILADFVSSVGNSSWLDIATTYSDGAGPASADIALGGTTVDAYSHGTRLSDAAIGAIVTGALARGAVPASESAVYAVLASGDIDATSGFCSAYCGWHETLPYGALTIKYAFIGGAWQCPDACSPVSRGPTPNGDLGADAMVSTLAHELVETITDPGQDAWMDATGYENADKCAWVFSGVFATASHAAANTPLGSRDFLIQDNWVNVPGGGHCGNVAPGSAPYPSRTATRTANPSHTLPATHSATRSPSASRSTTPSPSASRSTTRSVTAHATGTRTATATHSSSRSPSALRTLSAALSASATVKVKPPQR